jgi:hypothetical protein
VEDLLRRLSLSLAMLLVLSSLVVLDVRHVSASSPPADSVRYCDSVYYVNGWSYSGTHEDTLSKNSAYHTSKGDHTSEVPQRVLPCGDGSSFVNVREVPQSVLSEGSGGYLLNVRYKFTTGGLVKNQISKIEVEALARTDYSSEQYGIWLDIYNYVTAAWDNVGFFYGNTGNQTINWTDATVAADHSPADYVDSAGNMELKWFFWSGDFSKLRINFQCIKLTLRTWTFMAYLAGDTDIAIYCSCNDTINDMEKSSGSTCDVAVVAQVDFFQEYHPNETNCYLILKDNYAHNITSPIIWSQGEINTGDPLSLFDFVNKTTQRYPAKHYALNLLGHSRGWREVCWDRYVTDGGPVTFDYLNMTELKQALSMIKNHLGITFDLIGLDTCLCAQLEIAYQIKYYAQVMVGCEARQGNEFFGYEVTLTNLTDNPTMNATELAKRFVTNYKEYHLVHPGGIPEYGETISAVCLANVTALSECVDDLAAELRQNLEAYRNGVNQSRGLVEEYPSDENLDYVDIYHLAELLKQDINNGTVQNLCQQIKQALNATIISEWHRTDGPYPNSRGLSIYFPDVQEDYEAQYEYTEFCNSALWDEFLKAYLGI